MAFPASRRVIVDIGKIAARRPTIRGLIEADIGAVSERLGEQGHSLTAYLTVTLAQAIASQPDIQALRDWRGRLVVFDDVDIAVSIEIELEGRSFPLTHVVRSAQERSVADVSRELGAIKSAPHRSPTLEHPVAARSYVLLPGPIRRAALRLLYRLPDSQRRIMGTAGLSSVGMFGKGGGWGIGFPVHAVNLLVGGITETMPADGPGGPSRRIDLTFSFDHDVVDGAPAARFVSDFRTRVETGTALES